MTVIIAAKKRNGTVIVGADSRVTADAAVYTTKVPKVVKKGDYILGTAGDGGISELIIHLWRIPNKPPSADTDSFVHSAVRLSLQSLLQHYNIIDNDNILRVSKEDHMKLLLVIDSKVFIIELRCNDDKDTIYATIDIQEASLPCAIGSGETEAIVALRVLKEQGGSIKKNIEKAIEITAEFNNSVDSNVIFEEE